MSIAELLLQTLSRPPGAEDFPGGTARATLDNSLDYLLKTVPDFLDIVKGRDVLDFGCGTGLQAAALALRGYVHHVVGVDLPREFLQERWRKLPAIPNLTLTTDLGDATFDVVYSCSSFEHFADPVGILDLMHRHTRPGGRVIITFAEPWYSPRGSHMSFFTRIPWVNVLFPEKAVMRVRSRYRSDGARHYEEIEGGLNRMTIRRFENIVRNSGMRADRISLFAVKGLPLVTRIPVVREFLTSSASCVLTRTESSHAHTGTRPAPFRAASYR